MEKLEKEAYICREFLRRLSNQEFWEIFKKFYNIKNLDEFGINIYEKLEAYHAVLKAKVERATIKVEKAKQETLNTHSSTELNLLRAELETVDLTTGQLRFLLRSEEQKINEMLNTINGILKKFGEKPKHIFYHPRTEKIIEDIVCPHCEKINTDFIFNNMCAFCHELIQNPYKEHTICPNIECSSVINRSELFADKSAYELDSLKNQITCPYCESRFDWKKNRRQPEIFGLKICINCDMAYIPNKLNWQKQRLCKVCKRKGVDSFKLDNPEYQKKYRSKKK